MSVPPRRADGRESVERLVQVPAVVNVGQVNQAWSSSRNSVAWCHGNLVQHALALQKRVGQHDHTGAGDEVAAVHLLMS
jgi:hypothetical protein